MGAAVNAFLVRVNHFLVFVERDPRRNGCPFPVEGGVELDDRDAPDPGPGRAPPDLCVGVDPTDGHHYGVFRSPPRRARAGFHQVVGIPMIVRTWTDFLHAAADCGEVVGAVDDDFLS
jgi:hypothetical protein